MHKDITPIYKTVDRVDRSSLLPCGHTFFISSTSSSTYIFIIRQWPPLSSLFMCVDTKCFFLNIQLHWFNFAILVKTYNLLDYTMYMYIIFETYVYLCKMFWFSEYGVRDKNRRSELGRDVCCSINEQWNIGMVTINLFNAVQKWRTK